MTVKRRPTSRPRTRRAPAPDELPRNTPFREDSPSVALLWRDDERRRRGPKPGLDVERIARAAIAIADAEGLAAVSMQRIASEFDFTTMSLYRYVPGKAELLELMIDVAMGKAPNVREAGPGWRPRLERWAREISALYHAHPWALDVTNRLRVLGPNEFDWMNAGVEALADTGLTGPEIFDALLVLSGHVRIIARYAEEPSPEELRDPSLVTRDDWEAGVERMLLAHGDRYPALADIVKQGAFRNDTGDGWEFGLRCVLDGIAVRIAERQGARP
ncbi:Transcriptional regulator, TetR family [Labilithrix luteola]|uniref:Transcriptional regulator, TetR family n=1 Tax=Labilithrix luteola TaxID=1391654 RepID=A0A0K1PM67_9BACT|nr:TetR/AcrR family transcriptional regulator C-terminal domain-containing protein [Labilithrix luteola]AKU94620.1 Transcriptional regulator, TetR family [Labilithrix luteola]